MKTNYLKLGVLSLMLLAGTAMQAQQTTGDVDKDGDLTTTTDKGAFENVGKSSVLNGTIRVIDNKGTKKFLQVKNGLTLLTDATPDGGIVSTWQLGGSITNNTYIDVNGNAFSLDGLELVPSTSAAATSATTLSTGSNKDGISGSSDATTDTGWTVLIRDEATGTVKKLLASDLVKGGHILTKAGVSGVVTASDLVDVSIPSNEFKVSVYRNGAKLRAGVDYTLPGGSVVLVPQAVTNSPNDWAIYEGDEFEIHWIN